MKRILVTNLPPSGVARETVLELVVGTILAALRPLHWRDELPQLSEVSVDDVERILMETELSQLFIVRGDDRVYVFHKSIVDWLTRAASYDQRQYRHDFVVKSPELALLRRHGLAEPEASMDEEAWAGAIAVVSGLKY